MRVNRFDRGEITKVTRTPEGFLQVDAKITRIGVFPYLNADGTRRNELRHPDEVLKQDSLKSMEMLPITLLHPKEKKVDASNAQRLSVGFTGQNVKPDGKFITNTIKITDEKAIKAVEQDGVRELSLGYDVLLVQEDGMFDGERFDFKQTEISYNHLAIVPQARAGSEVRIALDGSDAAQDSVHPSEEEEDEETNKGSNTKPKEKKMDMVKVNLDGITYDAAPEVSKALDKALKRADEAEKNLETEKKNVSTIQAKYDSEHEELEKLKKQDNKEVINKAVESRLALISKAMEHLDEDEKKKILDMSDKEIKVAVIMKHSPEAKLDGKDDNYIDARYDAAIESGTQSSSIANQRKAVNNMSRGDSHKELDQEKSRSDMIYGLTNAWKNYGKKEAA